MGVGMHHIIGAMRVLSCMVAATSTSAFCPHPRARTRELRDGHSRPSLRLVTESDVMSLVEKAEELWARVERLRNEASDLSAQAESLGREAETSTADAAEKLLRLQSISEEKIREANDAQNLSLDLGALLDRAMSATREADEVEVLAEEAIAASEAALEQYLIDFPEDDEIDAIL